MQFSLWGVEEGNAKVRLFAFGKVEQRSWRNGERVWTRGACKQAQSAALFVSSCGAIRGPSAHNRLCLKGTHSRAPCPSSPRLWTEARTTHFHAPFYLIANGNWARRSPLSASSRGSPRCHQIGQNAKFTLALEVCHHSSLKDGEMCLDHIKRLSVLIRTMKHNCM